MTCKRITVNPSIRLVSDRAAGTKPVEWDLNVRPDTLDFQDRLYVANLYDVPAFMDLDNYRKVAVPVLDQGREGASTGFGLATVANCRLLTRKIVPDPRPVSAGILYEMAKRYDEWPGKNYSGSSIRGAMKGWHKQSMY